SSFAIASCCSFPLGRRAGTSLPDGGCSGLSFDGNCAAGALIASRRRTAKVRMTTIIAAGVSALFHGAGIFFSPILNLAGQAIAHVGIFRIVVAVLIFVRVDGHVIQLVRTFASRAKSQLVAGVAYHCDVLVSREGQIPPRLFFGK